MMTMEREETTTLNLDGWEVGKKKQKALNTFLLFIPTKEEITLGTKDDTLMHTHMDEKGYISHISLNHTSFS